MEAADKVLVSTEFMSDPNHGQFSCVHCHGGDPEAILRADAHAGMSDTPTIARSGELCGTCHAGTVAKMAGSLHTTLEGIRHSLVERAGGQDPLPTELHTSYNNHCSRCHVSCGGCHVSVPGASGGGLVPHYEGGGHRFQKTPKMQWTCTACHGSRVGDEYTGGNAGIAADVHYNRGMQCVGCHTGGEMHGDYGVTGVTHRYQVATAPRCEDCHPDDAAFRAVLQHTLHRDDADQLELACQVCHSTTYKQCYSCHVYKNEDGAAVYDINAATNFESPMDFKVGLNPNRDALHPAKWVTVRHVPIDPNNYDYYGTGLLTTFAANPTWRLATPHNIQRNTPQTASCNACHGNRDLFLGPDDLLDYEVGANAPTVVATPPSP